MRVKYVFWRDGWKALRMLLEIVRPSLDPCRVAVVASTSSSSAAARVWGLPRPFQAGFSLKPIYVIEVVWRVFKNYSCWRKIRVLLHEVAHIPSTMSGALVGHGDYFARRLREMEARLEKADLSPICFLLGRDPFLGGEDVGPPCG